MEIDIKAQYLAMAALFKASAPDPKYAGLCGVRVEPHADGAVIIATDGACMFVGVDGTGYVDEPANLSLCDSVVEYSAHDDKRRAVVDDAGTIVLKERGRVVFRRADCLLDDQDYPNWKKAVPVGATKFPLFPATLGVKYLQKIGALFEIDNRLNDAVFFGRVTAESTVVRFSNIPSIMVVLMPNQPGDWSPVAQMDTKWVAGFTTQPTDSAL